MRRQESEQVLPAICRAVWLVLPVLTAGIAHVAVIKRDLLRALALPLDGGRTWRGSPLLGPNKTWRGMVVMAVVTALLTQLQPQIARLSRMSWAAPARTALPPWLAGGLVGLAYSLAELPNSFGKRLLHIPPGRTLGPVQYAVDQLDSVIGCLIALRLLYRLSVRELALIFALGATLHVGVDAVLYPLGIKRR